jgi:exodeoxyribonuclease-5
MALNFLPKIPKHLLEADAKKAAAAVEKVVVEEKAEAAPPPASIYDDISLTEAQQKAVEIAKKLSRRVLDGHGTSVGVLTGYAGTGKTTVIRAISNLVGSSVVLAPTGKAAMRVTEATGLPASTIHRWLYYPPPDEEKGKVEWAIRPMAELAVPASNLIIIDEASMIDEKLWADILTAAKSIECSILCVGDSFQLPPVSDKDSTYFSVLDPSFKADFRVELTEIIRQALDSPIIAASMLIRQGREDEAFPLFYQYKSRQEFVEGADLFAANNCVTICHSNRARFSLNNAIRARRGYEELRVGEPLLVMRNCYKTNKFNGEITPFEGWSRITKSPLKVTDKYRHTEKETHFGVSKVEGLPVLLAEENLYGRMENVSYRAMTKKALRQMGLDSKAKIPLLHANLGYALTCHKSQGSEWDKVLVHIEPQMSYHTDECRRWLYTAITRAKTEVAYYRTE